jgi:hypothetical protein
LKWPQKPSAEHWKTFGKICIEKRRKQAWCFSSQKTEIIPRSYYVHSLKFVSNVKNDTVYKNLRYSNPLSILLGLNTRREMQGRVPALHLHF